MNNKLVLLLVASLLSQSYSYGQEYWPTIGKGVNLDFQTTEVNKIGYDPNYYDVFKAAGFESVRFFVKWGIAPEEYKDAIDGAIERGLTVVLAGFMGRSHGKGHFVEYWKNFAEFYKLYPKELVFEIMNEPKMAGFPNKPDDDKELVAWLSEAIVAIREVSKTRIIAVGGPSFNHANMLVKYITPEYLTYKLSDGTGFEEDKNIWGVFHHYQPNKWTHANKYKKLTDVNKDWKTEVVHHLDLGEKWSKTHDKKVYMSEWGSRLYNDRKEILEYYRYMIDEAKKRDIDWSYYCGVFNNAWSFALYTSEYGFEKTADIVEVLTGKKPELMHLPTNQLNNSEFMMDAAHWYSTDQVNITNVDGEGVDGSRALRCMVAFVNPKKPSIHQQTYKDWRFYADGYYMIQLLKGNTYNISLYAKSTTFKTELQVELGVASEDGSELWSSDYIEIDSDLKKYEFTYLHEAETVENARFTINFTERHSEIILDDIKLVGVRPE